MGRLLAIDYGRRRCGIAVTDTLRIVATALCTVPSAELIKFIAGYTATEPVDRIIVGLPKDMRGNPSVLAHRGMIDSGMHRMQRRSKDAVDRMAATIILNDYLQSRQYNSTD